MTVLRWSLFDFSDFFHFEINFPTMFHKMKQRNTSNFEASRLTSTSGEEEIFSDHIFINSLGRLLLSFLVFYQLAFTLQRISLPPAEGGHSAFFVT